MWQTPMSAVSDGATLDANVTWGVLTPKVRYAPSVRFRTLSLVVALCASCAGPAATDAAVCRDWIRRVCAAPRCDQVTNTLNVGDDCEDVLLARSGCGDEAFAFQAVTRTRFLSCRLALLRGGREEPVRPECLDVAESFEVCPDVVSFFRGSQ